MHQQTVNSFTYRQTTLTTSISTSPEPQIAESVITSGRVITDDTKAKTHVRFWLQKEEAELARLYPTNRSARDIAKDLGRTLSAVRAKARVMGLRRPNRRKAVVVSVDENASLNFGASVEQHSEVFHKIAKTSTGRAIWNNASITRLAELWSRLYSPTFIADYFGLRPGAVSMAAQRAGLPSRAGLTLVKATPGENPMSIAPNNVIAEQMVRRVCAITQTVFFQHPKHRRRQHYSPLGQQALTRRATGSIH